MKQTFIIIIVSVFIAASCSEKRPEGFYSQGRLEYKITYLNAHDGNFDPALLPKRMVLEFNNEFSTNTIDGFMGLFKLGNLIYFQKSKSVSYLKVLDQDYVFHGEKHEPMCCFDNYEGMKIEKDTSTKIIAGLKSNHAHAILPATGEEFDIYYTYDINIKNPNSTNPYFKINGVLTDFVLYMKPYKMRFVANKFNPEKKPKDNLGIPDDAKEISRAQMVYYMEKLMK